MQSFNEEELEQVNAALRGTIQNLTARLVELSTRYVKSQMEIEELKQQLACANRFFDKVSVSALANLTRKDTGL